jgi:hypothetical protein
MVLCCVVDGRTVQQSQWENDLLLGRFLRLERSNRMTWGCWKRKEKSIIITVISTPSVPK